MAHILILEDDPHRIAAFARDLSEHDLTIVNTALAARRCLVSWDFDVIFLDNDLGDTQNLSVNMDDENCGYAVAKFMSTPQIGAHVNRETHVIVHTLNPGAGVAIMDVLGAGGFENVYRMPWGSFPLKDVIQNGD